MQRITAPSIKSIRAISSPDGQSIIVTYTLHRGAKEHHFAFPANRVEEVVKQILGALPPDPEGRITTAVVKASRALGRPDGKVAIELQTDMGPIALAVGQSEIDILRANLTAAETLLRRATGLA